MNLRIAFKVLKRDSLEIHELDKSTVSRRLIRRATRRWQRYIRTHCYNHDFRNKPSRMDLHNSNVRTRRCQPIAELKRLWFAVLKELEATSPEWLTQALLREVGVNEPEALTVIDVVWNPADAVQILGRLKRTTSKKEIG